MSEVIIIGLFGKQWYPSIEIFEILAFKLITFPASAFVLAVLLSQGFSKENFNYGLIKRAMRIIPIIIAMFFGFKAFLYALIAVSFISLIFSNYVNSKFLKISFVDQLYPFLGPGLVFTVLIIIAKFIIPIEAYAGYGVYLIGVSFVIIYGVLFLKSRAQNRKKVEI